ncbi:MAG: hypothetical protein R3F55_11710 [Alphaproteobacteria bacterium]
MSAPAAMPPVPGHVDPARLGRAIPLAAVIRLVLVGMALLAVFGSEALHRYAVDLPLWMAPVNDWTVDATAAWHGWMQTIGATAPHDWIGRAVEDLRMAGAAG